MKLFSPEDMINHEGYIPGEIPVNISKKARKCNLSHIVMHKPKKKPVEYTFPWEEYKKQCDQSYIENVVLGKDL